MKKGTTLKDEIQRVQGIPPKQYQQGWTEFYKLKFFLTPDVLIPRPETELLVDEVLRVAKDCFVDKSPRNDVIAIRQLAEKQSPITILDVGTGSGCIAISIAKNLPTSRVFALDISDQALAIANQNAKLHGVEDKIIFLKSDLLSIYSNTLVYHTNRPDIIVANLPYIPTARLLYIVDPMVRDFEPRIALDGGKDGFELYRRMFKQMIEMNFFPKYLIVEIDEKQGELAESEVKKMFPNSQVEIKKDLAKLDRILIIKF